MMRRQFGLTDYGFLFVCNSVIAVLLYGTGFSPLLWNSFVFSQSIGWCAFATITLLLRLLEKSLPILQLIGITLGVILSVSAGGLFALLLLGQTGMLGELNKHFFFLKVLLFSSLFAGIITFIFVTRERLQAARLEIELRKNRQLAAEKQLTETELRLLQAQVEPHFLFNVLTSVQQLIEEDAGQAKELLENLNVFLRSTLDISRQKDTTLEGERRLLTAYLSIFKMRMAERLHYQIDFPAELLGVVLPPMLLQPLVENSLKHGLDSLPQGGEIRVAAQKKGATLLLRVSDTGFGIKEYGTAGVGLGNLQQRLAQLYDGKAALLLSENVPRGTVVTLEIPNA